MLIYYATSRIFGTPSHQPARRQIFPILAHIRLARTRPRSRSSVSHKTQNLLRKPFLCSPRVSVDVYVCVCSRDNFFLLSNRPVSTQMNLGKSAILNGRPRKKRLGSGH